MAHDVFISHSADDKPIADGICANLEAAGFRCWIAPRDIAPGEDWPAAISNAISHSSVMVLVFSASSNASEEVSRELFLAANSKLIIIPFKIENVEPEAGKFFYLGRVHWLDAMNPPTLAQINLLIERVKALVPVKVNGGVIPAALVSPQPEQPKQPKKSEQPGKIEPYLLRRLIVIAGVILLCTLLAIGGGFLLKSNPALPSEPSSEDLKPTPTILDTKAPTNYPTETSIPGLPMGTWRNASPNGFNTTTHIYALATFHDSLYVGAINFEGGGGIIWKTDNGNTWEEASQPGFGYGATNPIIFDLTVYNNQLYAGTGMWVDDDGAGGEIWRSGNGTDWTRVVQNGFGNAANFAIVNLAEFNGHVYACTLNTQGGTEIWRSASGGSNEWQKVISAKFGERHNICTGFATFQEALFIGIGGDANASVGAEIWKSGNGTDWSQVGKDGLGNQTNIDTGGLAVWESNLYVGTRNNNTGGQLWRTSNGSTWDPVILDGFGNPDNGKLEGVYVFQGALYVGTANDKTGLEVWRTNDGQYWEQINKGGFGNPGHTTVLWSNPFAEFMDQLFIGTTSNGVLAEVWSYQN